MNIKLYYHKTSGGAEYLMDTFKAWKFNGKSGKEGVMNDKTKFIVRIDGDITKDAELSVREEVMPKTIKIIIEGGCLRDVQNLPKGWNYELEDLDNELEKQG